MFNIGANVLPNFKGPVFHLTRREISYFTFHWGASRAQNGLLQNMHIVIMAVSLMLLL